MKWVPDRMGRFFQRPRYDPEEIDLECESIITAFLQARNGAVTYPIGTNDLVVLLEQETQDLDLYANPQELGDGVQGLTDFFPGQKPRVRITRELSEQTWRENRLRTTLTHELGHVKFHNFLWSFHQSSTKSLFGSEQASDLTARCKRDTILTSSTIDWMEWQAGYASGTFLMPITPLQRLVEEVISEYRPISVSTPAGHKLITQVQESFQVSAEAARVRLLKLGYLTERAPSGSFFFHDGS